MAAWKRANFSQLAPGISLASNTEAVIGNPDLKPARLLGDQQADITGDGDTAVCITHIQSALAVIDHCYPVQRLLQVQGIAQINHALQLRCPVL